MAKSNSKTVNNLLRLSGMIYAVIGSFHVIRYFREWEFKVGEFELTFLGSLLIGCFFLFLSFSCFQNSKKK